MTIVTFEEFSEPVKHAVEAEIGGSILYADKQALDIPEDTEILICRDRDINAEILANCPSLKMIYVLSVGIDKMPFHLLNNRDIRVVHTPGDICSREIAEYVMSGILFFNAKIYECIENKKNHFWQRNLTTRRLQGKTLVIAGTGMIGQQIAQTAEYFGMNVFGISRSGKAASHFQETFSWETAAPILKDASFFVSTLPLTPDTEKKFDKNFFELLNESCVFLNIGRGKCVNEKDLVSALQEKKIHGAVLDVFEQEPLNAQSGLWDVENLIITPHISGRIPQFLDRSLEYFPPIYVKYLNHEKIAFEIDLGKGY